MNPQVTPELLENMSRITAASIQALYEKEKFGHDQLPGILGFQLTTNSNGVICTEIAGHQAPATETEKVLWNLAGILITLIDANGYIMAPLTKAFHHLISDHPELTCGDMPFYRQLLSTSSLAVMASDYTGPIVKDLLKSHYSSS